MGIKNETIPHLANPRIKKCDINPIPVQIVVWTASTNPTRIRKATRRHYVEQTYIGRSPDAAQKGYGINAGMSRSTEADKTMLHSSRWW